jgi:predicted nucleic acid-binding protein
MPVHLNDIGEGHFEQLVAGPAQSTLDDGEAATIAFGLQAAAGVVIDDKKARNMCAARFPSLEVKTTCDLFRHPVVMENLGKEKLRQAVHDSLTGARMSVRQENLEWVISLLGDQAVKLCKSLPIQRLKKSS